MSIELHEITEPVDIPCPTCGAPLLRVSKHCLDVVGDGYYLVDGDTVDGFYGDLTPEEKDPSGNWCELLQGSRPCCGVGYVVIEDVCVNAPMNDRFARSYMTKNEPGETTFLVATRGAERWIVGRCDTPLGPMLTHQFGPFAWADTSWIGPNGVTSCRSSWDNSASPWAFADAFLLERWNDLQELTRSLPVPASAAEYLAAHPDSPKTSFLPAEHPFSNESEARRANGEDLFDEEMEWWASHCGQCAAPIEKSGPPEGGVYLLPLCASCKALGPITDADVPF